jgi:hypothetical protein
MAQDVLTSLEVVPFALLPGVPTDVSLSVRQFPVTTARRRRLAGTHRLWKEDDTSAGSADLRGGSWRMRSERLLR